MRYDLEGNKYICHKGYCFINKLNGMRAKELYLAPNDSFLNYDVIEEINVPEEHYISDIQQQKLTEMSDECNKIITAGFEMELEGEKVHFSLTPEDQINLLSSSMAVAAGQQLIPYHIDGVLCKFYTPNIIQQIVTAATNLKTYHTTYYNSLKDYVLSLDDEEVGKVYYGMKIPEVHQSEVLKALYAQMEAVE